MLKLQSVNHIIYTALGYISLRPFVYKKNNISEPIRDFVAERKNQVVYSADLESEGESVTLVILTKDSVENEDSNRSIIVSKGELTDQYLSETRKMYDKCILDLIPIHCKTAVFRHLHNEECTVIDHDEILEFIMQILLESLKACLFSIVKSAERVQSADDVELLKALEDTASLEQYASKMIDKLQSMSQMLPIHNPIFDAYEEIVKFTGDNKERLQMHLKHLERITTYCMFYITYIVETNYIEYYMTNSDYIEESIDSLHDVMKSHPESIRQGREVFKKYCEKHYNADLLNEIYSTVTPHHNMAELLKEITNEKTESNDL